MKGNPIQTKQKRLHTDGMGRQTRKKEDIPNGSIAYFREYNTESASVSFFFFFFLFSSLLSRLFVCFCLVKSPLSSCNERKLKYINVEVHEYTIQYKYICGADLFTFVLFRSSIFTIQNRTISFQTNDLLRKNQPNADANKIP